MLNIFYGRESIDKEKFIFDNLQERALIMVPEQYTLEAERQAFRHLGVSALMDVEVVSASSLGSNVLRECGGGRRNFINKYGRHMLLYKSAAQERENLQVFRGMEEKNSFLDAVNNFISEMKQYDCCASDLKAMAESFGEDSYTCRKLMDIYRIFSDYERQIEGKYTDSEDYIDLFLQKMDESQLVKGNHIWVYGFDSVAPKTMALLGKLMTTAEQVNLVLTWDDEARDRELFQLTGIVMDNVVKLAETLGVPWKKSRVPQEYQIKDRKESISHIEKELYAMPACRAANSDGITLVEAANLYNEAESAAAYVLHLVRDKGLRFRDIRVVCNDSGRRGAIIERVFQEYGIEIFSDAKRDIMSNPLTQYITSLISVVTEKYSTQSLFAMLKSGFGDLTGEELASLENYGIKYKIKGTMWKKTLRRGKAEYGEEGLAAMEELRRRAVEKVLPLEELFKADDTGRFLKSFYNYLCDDLQLREKTLDFIARQEEKELFDLADETAAIWESLSDILNQIYEIMGEDPFEAHAFEDIFRTGLSQVEIGLLPPTEDGLVMGNIQRSRSGRVKALVVVGANEGVLPQERPSGGLFSAEERERFREDGKELCKVDSVRTMEEKLAIYRTLSAPTEYLWMSCSMSDEEGNQLKPSEVFLKIRELFEEITVVEDVINSRQDNMLINSCTAGLRNLCRALEASAEGRPLSRQWQEALSWFEKNKPQELKLIRESIEFTGKQNAIGEDMAAAVFGKEGQKELSLSPSRIEKFSRCPFSHMVAYGLKPEERRVYEAAPREIGDIYHRCLMKLTKELTEEGKEITDPESPWMTVTRQECRKIVEKEIEAIAGEYKEGLLKAGSVEDYRGKRLSDICSRVCWTIVEQVRVGNIKSMMAEVPFGRRGTLPPVEVDTGKGKVYIEGIIDRVDYLPDDRVKIIDYKTGNETFSVSEAAAGYRLQLMMYMQAACTKNRKPAGVFYFKIKEPMVDFSQKEPDRETLEKEIRKSFRLDGVMVDDPQIIKDIAGEFEGFSEIVPIRNTKEGIKNTGKEGLMSPEDFHELQEAVEEKIKEAAKKLMEGNIEAHPMKTAQTSACAYCSYKGICRFDTIFEGCSYNIVR